MMSGWITNWCLFKRFSGLPCPGCGLTRAFWHLAHGDVAGAFFYHPLFWLVPLIFVAVLFQKKVPLLKRLLHNQTIIIGILVLFLGTYLIRMLLYFPTVVPMNVEPDSVLGQLVQWLAKKG